MPEVLSLLNELLNMADIAKPITEKDVSACHRVGKKTDGKIRQVSVRFVSRQHVHDVFKVKKKLSDIDRYENLFITDDLTQLRLKLRAVLKGTPGVTGVHSVNGSLHCTKDNKQFTVSNPDDLHVLGIDVDLKKLGLESLE